MNDEQLAAELERRANAASPRPDWAGRDLLPAVWHEIDARPVPVMTSRWSPLAGLAGLVVALLVLVVAVPRLTLAPPSATSAPSDTTSPERTVLETTEFYALLTSDQLEGKTVLVNGRIGPAELRLGPVCGLQDLCYFGPLEGTVRPLDVSVRGYATKEGPDAFELLARGGNPWRWWHRPVAPVEGTLLLSADMFRNVEFLGRVSRSEALTWSIDAINRIEPGTIRSDDVVLVEGWLNGVSGMRCLPLIDAVIEGLTNRYCSLEWIADGDETQSQPRVQVQRGAYHNFAQNATAPPFEPRQGTYALAPRLEGWCEGANPPCWQWTAVARVDIDASDVPSPSPPPSTAPSTIECSVPDSRPVTIADDTGLVTTCQTLDVGDEVGQQPRVTNPDGDLTRLRVTWGSSGCVRGAAARFTRDGNAIGYYALTITQDEIVPGCYGPAIVMGFELEFVSGIDASAVFIDFTQPAPTPSPSPNPTTAPTPHAIAGAAIECADPNRRAPDISITDHTGTVAGCEAFLSDATAAEVAVENSGGDTSSLTVTWPIEAVCNSNPARLELWGPQTVDRPTEDLPTDYDLLIDRSVLPETQSGCGEASARQGIRIRLESPLEADLVKAFVSSGPTSRDSVETPDGTFEFVLTTDSVSLVADRPIDVKATLTYRGPQESIWIAGGTEWVVFRIEQLGGWFGTTPISGLLCGRLELTRDEPYVTPFQKIGGYGSSDPHADFYRSYFDDPELRLPPGDYRITSRVGFTTTDSCREGESYGVNASIVIHVR